MKSLLLAAIVLVLVFCIVAIVYSPFVDLPLTTLRADGVAAAFYQILFLAWAYSLTRGRASTPMVAISQTSHHKTRCTHTRQLHLIDLICAYLC